MITKVMRFVTFPALADLNHYAKSFHQHNHRLLSGRKNH